MTIESSGAPDNLKLKFLKGNAFGFRQKTLIGSVEVDNSCACDPQKIHDFFKNFLDEELPRLDEQQPAAIVWTSVLLAIQHFLQSYQKVPVFEGGKVLHAKILETGPATRVVFAAAFHEARASTLAFQFASRLMSALRGDGEFSGKAPEDGHAIVNECFKKLERHALPGTNNIHFLRAAHRMGIPYTNVTPEIFSYGHGRNSRWLSSTMTEYTSNISSRIAKNKSLTTQILRQHGMPAPRHAIASDADKALAIAANLGYPVVVKPDDQDQGRGVMAGLKTPESVVNAFAIAREFSKRILIEKHCEGEDYRLTVFRNDVIKIVHRRPGGIVGDNVHSVAQLVEEFQRLPRSQKIFRQRGVMLLELDDEAHSLLTEHGLTRLSVPASGQFIPLRRKSNISTGGSQTLVTSAEVHPDNRELAIRACQAIRLDLCGVDMILPDIGRSWRETGGAVIELNASPQLGIDVTPEAYDVILRKLTQERWDIPLRLIICENPDGIPDPAELNASFLTDATNAISTPDGVWVDGKLLTSSVDDGFHAAGILLGHEHVRGGVCVMTIDEVMQSGLPAYRFDGIRISDPAGNLRADSPAGRRLARMIKGHVSHPQAALQQK